MFGFKKRKQKKFENQKKDEVIEKEEIVIENQDSLDLTNESTETEVEEFVEKNQKDEDLKKEEVHEDSKPKKRKTVYHVTKHSLGGWQIKKAGGERAIKRFETQLKAIEYAKILEKEKGIAYVIHKADGKTRKKKY